MKRKEKEQWIRSMKQETEELTADKEPNFELEQRPAINSEGYIANVSKEQFDRMREDFLMKKEELFQQKGKGQYQPLIGKYIIISCLMLAKPPVSKSSPIDEIELFNQIVDLIAKVVDAGLMLTPERLWLYLGITESEFYQAKSDPFDARSKIFEWFWQISDSIAMQNVQLGNAALDARQWADRTRTNGIYVPSAEKAQIKIAATIIENEQLKGREAAERLLGKNFDKLLMEG